MIQGLFLQKRKSQSPKELCYCILFTSVLPRYDLYTQVYDICCWCSRLNNFLDCYSCKSFLSLEQSSTEEIYSLVYQIEVQEKQKSNRRAATNEMYLRFFPIANVQTLAKSHKVCLAILFFLGSFFFVLLSSLSQSYISSFILFLSGTFL